MTSKFFLTKFWNQKWCVEKLQCINTQIILDVLNVRLIQTLYFPAEENFSLSYIFATLFGNVKTLEDSKQFNNLTTAWEKRKYC